MIQKQGESIKGLGLASGVGMVVADTVGSGVFLSTGFMLSDLSAGQVLLAWTVGALLALCGAWAYGAVATALPRSGGEYRYLADLWHPFLGFLAGFASLLVGFSAPLAIDAVAVGAFSQKLMPFFHPVVVAVAVLVALTALNALSAGLSVAAQNGLVVVKLALVVVFIAVGLLLGHTSIPVATSLSSTTTFPTGPFVSSLFYIAFAFSGWNATCYAAGEFRQGRRQVAWSMAMGTVIVSALYLLLNFVFVANLTPSEAQIVFRYDSEKLTLGHAVATKLTGALGGHIFSAFMILSLLSAMSALLYLGPRVYVAMAADGYLPSFFKGVSGKPPVLSVLLQGAIALGLVLLYDVRAMLSNIGAVLTLFSALTVAAVFRLAVKTSARATWLEKLAAVFYALFSLWMLWFAFRGSDGFRLWAAVLLLLGALAYGVVRKSNFNQAVRTEEV